MFISTKIGRGKEIWSLALAGGVITYGGVSMFVAAFALYPIGAALFKEASIPKDSCLHLLRLEHLLIL